jgi:hypothetical protein
MTVIIDDLGLGEEPMHPLELMVEDQPGTNVGFNGCYRARWCDDAVPRNIFLANIPDTWLDLIPYMAARKLLQQGYNPERLLIVKLRGADFDLVRLPLGVVAAPPLPNINKPVTKPTHCYWDHTNVDVELNFK